MHMQPKKQLKVQYIGIFEEIDSFYWPKMHFLKEGQKIWAWADPPPSFGQCPKENVFFPLTPSLIGNELFIFHSNYKYLIIIHYSLSFIILRGIPNINIRSSKYMAWIAEQGMPVHMHVEKVGIEYWTWWTWWSWWTWWWTLLGGACAQHTCMSRRWACDIMDLVDMMVDSFEHARQEGSYLTWWTWWWTLPGVASAYARIMYMHLKKAGKGMLKIAWWAGEL